ncbi:RHS repeat-associated core domain-containing protein [Flavobacterium humi]|uniref:Insecticide toxin TcdB middle/N-terminal domain-containing protein n=1 Tax=Flavobacterium humi TaxID=2562683 RepID=A0A4Z0LBW7_9FLAO|nr:RHS repeat-associated core domain-containing protein [Flavobacterium humi]TGD59380.1 hypothetical protein E4635_00130 [Flavobacterium humi]
MKLKLRLSALLFLIANSLFSQNYHDTQGRLEVSSSGQTVYTLPVAMPPSIKDVGPVINLTYVSGQAGGIAGQGWNISTVSSISRMATRQDIDGMKDGVDFDDNDKLALDGQRLLKKSGEYWADNSTYETEVQSNTKIELKGTGSTIYFIVTAPDGSKTWYGNYGGMNATDATAFYIVRFEDTNGNFMTYHYAKPYNKSLCITEIRFSANVTTNATPLNKIVFTYKEAARKENAYIKGIKIEKVELLDKIEVFTNSLLFRKYQLTHVTDADGYQRVSQLQEFNGSNEAVNPVVFEYNTTGSDGFIYSNTYTDALDLSTSPDMAGDFDGDGRLDFITSKNLYTKLFQGTGSVYSLPFLGSARQRFAATTLTNGKINQKQSIVYSNESLTSVEFKIYNLDNATVVNSYSKIITMDNVGYCDDLCTQFIYDENGNLEPESPPSKCTSPTFAKNSNQYLEGDFNGDGLSEVLILGSYQSKKYVTNPQTGGRGVSSQSSETAKGEEPGPNTCHWEEKVGDFINSARLVDLNPAVSTAENTAGNVALVDFSLLQVGKRFVMDFNSDGKSDILMIDDDKNYKVVSFKQLQSAPWIQLEVIGQGVMDSYSKTKQILFGDYNGDGKPDVMVPEADGNGCEGCSQWHIYYSNPNPAGGAFFVKESHNIVEYRPSSGNAYSHEWHYSSYYALDINKDGKSDLVRVFRVLYQPDPFFDPKNIDSQWNISSYINTIGYNNGFTAGYGSMDIGNIDDNSLPIPLVSNYKYQGFNSEVLMIRYHGNNAFDKTVSYVNFFKNYTEENLLKKVTQSGGAIVDELTYKNMEPDPSSNGLGSPDGFYSSEDALQYPFIEIKQLPTTKLVSQLKNTSAGVTKFQDFSYLGYVEHVTALGSIGFKKTARSGWYKNPGDKKTWNVTENNPLQRGANSKTYIQLLSSPFSFANNSTGLINKVENLFTEATDPVTKRYSILLANQKTTDYLTNVVSEKVYNNYSSDFLLPTNVTSNAYLGTTLQGTTNIVTVYDNAGNFIGRPKQVTTTTTAYSNTQVSIEKYSYDNGNLTGTEKNANGAPETIVEAMAYFPNGLLKSKTLSATGTNATNSVSPRTTSYTYDTTNRFVKTITDADNLVTTNNSYDSRYGTVLSQTNPYGLTTVSVYDNWGKRTKITDFLGKSITYAYSRANNVYTTTETGDDGSGNSIESDALARVIRKGSKDISGVWNYITTEYDYLGRKTRDSEPYASTGSPSQWTSYEYDDYSRPIKTTAHTGKIITTTYAGLKITANDEVLTKSKTTNANGHVVSATDTPGGTILYSYDAVGNLLESNYDGIATTMKYDKWGRKEELKDSSAGTYTYTYNAFGELLTETVLNKGTTSYTLDPVGKVLTKTVLGFSDTEKTNIKSTYTYDPTYKWVTGIAVTNTYDGNSSYAYTYDTPTKQLKKTVETLPGPVVFTKELTFDTFGRIDTEITTGTAHGKTSTKTIKHTYKNGKGYQMFDGANLLWQADSVNARGQLTGATLGNGLTITNTYDAYGFPSQFKHDKAGTTPVNIMTLNTTFEPKRGNLTSRYNSMFDIKEDFQYDTLDRLTQWKFEGEVIVNCTFNTGVDGFYYYEFDSGGSVTRSGSRIRITTNAEYTGTEKKILTNAVIGKTVKIKGDYAWTSGNSNVHLMIVERNPLNSNFIETDLGIVSTGTFQKEYTVQTYTDVYFRLGIKEDVIQPGVAPSATFTLDNFIVTDFSGNTQTYDDRGRITANNLGTYNYSTSAKPYQQTSVTPLSSEASGFYQSRGNLNVTYNAFKSPVQIEEIGVDKVSFAYNMMQQRSAMYYGSTNDDRLVRPYRKYYSGDGSMEIKYTLAGNVVEFITYIGGDAYNAPVVLKSDGTAYNYYYLHRDYQGSVLAITNATGSVVEKRAFDPWGNVTKVQDGTGNNLTKLTFFDRGYTGHEHLQSVGLINMNGRLYDPKLHRFLQPDNFVQDPYNTQNYNRYGYVLNNPLKYTDPSGEELISAIAIGAFVGIMSYMTMGVFNDTDVTFSGILKSSFVGAVSGAITCGIGSAVSSISSFAMRATVQALAHGTFQGLVSGVQGTGFWTGFAAGSISSVAASLYGGVGYEAAGWHGLAGCSGSSDVGMIIFGTVSGGAGAALTGGNFWQGAVTGLVVSGLNHAMHSEGSADDNGYDEKGNKINDKGGDEIDYLYRKGKIIASKKVFSFTDESSEITSDYRAYGIKIHSEGTGLIFSEGLKEVGLMYVFGRATELFTSATGGLKQWIRIGPSFSRALNEPMANSIRWGASPRYLNRIRSDQFQLLNYRIRNMKLPGNSWRVIDPGHFHLKRFN